MYRYVAKRFRYGFFDEMLLQSILNIASTVVTKPTSDGAIELSAFFAIKRNLENLV